MRWLISEGEEAARKDAEAAWESEAKRAREEEKARGEAERNQMLHLVGLARQAWSKNDLPQMLELLRLPAGHAIAAVIYLGEPVKQPRRLTRRGVDEFATVDTFDGPHIAG